MTQFDAKREIKPAVTALLCAAASLLIYGCAYSNDPNTAQIIPFIKKLMNPALYPGDFYIASQSAFPSLYPALMAKLAIFFPLEKLHLWLYIAFRIWFLRLIYSLALEISGREDTSVLSCLIIAVSPLTNVFALMGEDPLMKATMFQTAFAAPFAVLSLIYFLRERYIRAFVLVGLIYFVNGLVGNFLAALYLSGFIFMKENRAAMLKAGAVFACLMTAWAAWYLRLKNPFGGASAEFVGLLKLWYPGHYFPSQWSMLKWTQIAVFVPLFSYLYVSGMKRCRKQPEMRAFIFAFAAMWACAAVFAEIIPLRRIIMLQFFRSDCLFAIFAVIFAAGFIADFIDELSLAQWRGAAASALLLYALFELIHPLAATAAAALFLLLRIFAVLRKEPKPLPAMSGNGLKVTVVMAAVLFAPFIFQRLAAGELDYTGTQASAWIKTQLWVKENTPAGAVFLTPEDMDGWRVFSERSPVVEWLDGAAMHWAPGAEKVWISRINDLSQSRSHAALDDKTAGAVGICAKYGAEYFVVHQNEKPAGLNPVYENAGFAVFKARQ